MKPKACPHVPTCDGDCYNLCPHVPTCEGRRCRVAVRHQARIGMHRDRQGKRLNVPEIHDEARCMNRKNCIGPGCRVTVHT